MNDQCNCDGNAMGPTCEFCINQACMGAWPIMEYTRDRWLTVRVHYRDIFIEFEDVLVIITHPPQDIPHAQWQGIPFYENYPYWEVDEHD